MDRDIIDFIISHEARLDSAGHLRVYQLPPGDGGGSYEVAGVCDKFHPELAARLKSLVEGGYHEAALQEVRTHVAAIIAPVAMLHRDQSANWFMCDLCYNRGETGAKLIAQRALKSMGLYAGGLDGVWGPKSQKGFAAEEASGPELVPRLFAAWIDYEHEAKHRYLGNPFWQGLLTRRVDLLRFTLNF